MRQITPPKRARLHRKRNDADELREQEWDTPSPVPSWVRSTVRDNVPELVMAALGIVGLVLLTLFMVHKNQQDTADRVLNAMHGQARD